jgi:polygalacturonase
MEKYRKIGWNFIFGWKKLVSFESYKKGFESSSNFNVPDKISKEELVTVKDFLRPVMVSLVGCDKVLLDGPTFQNSPAWNLHPLMCSNVILRNLTVRNPWFSKTEMV